MSAGRPPGQEAASSACWGLRPWRGEGVGDSGSLERRHSHLTLISNLRSKLYTADLESGLHYLLRVELATHRTLAGAELRTLKDFVTIVAKVCGVCSGLGAQSVTLRNMADLNWMCTLLASSARPLSVLGA